MKFIHTADWHIGAGRGYIPQAALRTFDTIDAIYDLALREHIRTVVMAGDVFDSPNIEEFERRLLLRKIAAFDRAGIATLMIPGNHDYMSEQHTTLDYLDMMTQAGGFQSSVVTQTTQLVIRDRVGFLLFTGQPWGRVGDHIAAIRRGSVRPAIDKLVVVAHQTIAGSRTATGMQLPTGIRFDPDREVDMYCFGDIHVSQQLSPNSWYSGSPLQVNFGEPDQQGVLVFDTDDLQNPVFQPLTSRRLATVCAGAEIPDDAIVRVIYDEKPVLAQNLPGNVVKVAWQPSVVDLTNLRSEDGLLAGLDEVLERRGLTDTAERELAIQGVRAELQLLGDPQ